MIDYLLGVDGGGTGTRVRLARADGSEIGQGRGGPSGLAHGIDNAWSSIDDAVAGAFAAAGVTRPANGAVGIGLGLAGVHNRQWAAAFAAANPGYGAMVVETDSFTTLVGAHRGRPGVVLAIGTGSVGIALLPGGEVREVGGWGFPAGDEGSGAWIGLRAVNHIEQVMDGRQPPSPFAQAVIEACGGSRDAFFAWAAQANQTSYAALAPLVIAHAAANGAARGFLADAGSQLAVMAAALDPSGELPVALCGGLSAPLRAYLPATLLARGVEPHADSAAGALRIVQMHLEGLDCRAAAQGGPSGAGGILDKPTAGALR